MAIIKPKLLVTTSGFPRWDGDFTSLFVYELSKRLSEEFDVVVLAPHSSGTDCYEKKDGMKIYRFRYFFNKHEVLSEKAIIPNLKANPLLWLQVPFFFISQLFAMCRLVKKYKIDIVHAHWIIPQGFIAVLNRFLFKKSFKIVVTSHGGDIFGLRAKPFLMLKRWILNHADRLTVVSNAIKEEVLSLGVRDDLPIDVISMGVDLSRFSPENYDESIKKEYGIDGPFLLFVGRLSEKKGVRYLIEAMPEIIEDFPDAKLLIIGDGELRDKLEKQADSIGLNGKNIIFTGSISNNELPRYYATADIFIGPSIIAKGGDREGLGLTFVESMGSGTITIGTDLPAIADVIENGKTGLIVRQKNTKDIVDTVKSLLSDNEKTNSIAHEGMRFVRANFDWEGISRKYAQVIESL